MLVLINPQVALFMKTIQPRGEGGMVSDWWSRVRTLNKFTGMNSEHWRVNVKRRNHHSTKRVKPIEYRQVRRWLGFPVAATSSRPTTSPRPSSGSSTKRVRLKRFLYKILHSTYIEFDKSLTVSVCRWKMLNCFLYWKIIEYCYWHNCLSWTWS